MFGLNQRILCLAVVGVGMFSTPLVFAQDSGTDASTDAGDASVIPVVSIDPLATCLRECLQGISACVDANMLRSCYDRLPSCRAVRPQEQEVTERFCDMCAYRGQPANNCPVATANAAPQAQAAPVRRVRSRPRPEDVCRDHHPPLAFNSSECLCLRENGVWERNRAYLRDGRIEHADACVTPSFTALEGRVAALESRPQGLTMDQVRGVVDPAVAQERNERVLADMDLGRAITNLSTRVDSNMDGVRRWNLRRQGEIDALRRGNRTSALSGMGFRLGSFAGMDIRPIESEYDGTPTTHGPATPFYFGLDFSWHPRFAPAWYGDAGAGLGIGYAGTTTNEAYRLESLIHLGFLWHPRGNLSLGLGGLFMERMNFRFQGTNAFIGPYAEIMLSSTAGPGFGAFVSLRVSPGARLQALPMDGTSVEFNAVALFTIGMILL